MHIDQLDLIKKAQVKNREAQKELFTLHAPKMLSVCRQYIKDFQYAEEAMLNGFLKVFTHIKKFESRGSFEGWVRRIMINESISLLRKQKRTVFIDDETFFKSATINHFETETNVSELQYLVDNLQDDYRIVFNLFAVEGYKHKEIAKLLQITVNTSKMRFFKARKQLQDQYAQLKNIRNGK